MKGIIIQTTREIAEKLEAGELRLPDGVHIDAKRDRFEYDGYELRLKGVGLPDWSDTRDGGVFDYAIIEWDASGAVSLSRVERPLWQVCDNPGLEAQHE